MDKSNDLNSTDLDPSELEQAKNITSTETYAYDDTENGNRFSDMNRGHLLFSFTENKWKYYDGQRWKDDDCGEVKRCADQVIKKYKKGKCNTDADFSNKAKLVFKMSSRTGKQNMINEATHLI